MASDPDYRKEIEEHLFGLDEISDPKLRRKVLSAWEIAIGEGEYESILEVPWFPAEADDVPHISHQNDVTKTAINIFDAISGQHPELDIDRDLVIAGALIHDLSKMVERSEHMTSETGEEYVPHPFYGVHILAKAGLSARLQHILLSHTEASGVEPITLEAEIVRVSDVVSASTLLWKSKRTLLHQIV